jgi:hypothetical protein
MKITSIHLLACAFSLLTWCSCQNATPNQAATGTSSATPTETTTPPTPTTPTPAPTPAIAAWLVVNAKGDAMLFGKKVNLSDLPKLLRDTLSRMSDLPPAIPVTFDGEVLMGTRGDVKTTLREALTQAQIKKIGFLQDPEKMVKDFYAWYVAQQATESGYQIQTNRQNADNLLTSDLTKSLTKAATAEGGAGADYFLQAQDFGEDWGKVRILQSKTTGYRTVLKIQLGEDPKMIQQLLVTVVSAYAGIRIEKVALAK